jgi:hypothetical protein
VAEVHAGIDQVLDRERHEVDLPLRNRTFRAERPRVTGPGRPC